MAASILSSFPAPAAEEHLHSRMLPPAASTLAQTEGVLVRPGWVGQWVGQWVCLPAASCQGVWALPSSEGDQEGWLETRWDSLSSSENTYSTRASKAASTHSITCNRKNETTKQEMTRLSCC